MADVQRTARVKFDGDARGLASAARRAERAIDGVDKHSRVMSGALASVGAMAAKLGPLLLAAFALAPAAAAAAATGIVLAFGGAIAGLGLAFAAQSKRVKREFRDLKDHVVDRMREISRPFESTLVTIANVARRTFDSFVPALRSSFRRLAPVIGAFAKQFGRAFEGLIPAIRPLTRAFSAIIGRLGPVLRRVFAKIGDSLKNLAKTVIDNKTEFTLLFEGMLNLIPKVIDLIAWLARGFGAFIRNVGPWAATALRAFRKLLTVWQFVTDHILGAFDRIISGAAKAFGWIPGIGDKLKRANAEFDKFRAGVKRSFDKAKNTLDSWATSLDRLPKVIELRGKIDGLRSAIARAKERLKTVPPSKQTAIRARIDQLRARVKAAKRSLGSIRDKTVTIRANGIIDNDAARIFSGQGRIPRFAHGGRASGTFLVGERGPELVTVGGSAQVTPNHALGGDVHVLVELDGAALEPRMVRVLSEHDRSLRRRAGARVGGAR